jgi:hypothetical protein
MRSPWQQSAVIRCGAGHLNDLASECAQQKDTFYSHWATHSSILRRTRAEGLPVSAESTENLVMPDDAPAMTSSDDLHQLEQVIYPLICHTSDPRPRSLTSSPPPPRRQNGLRMSYGLRQTAAFGSGGPADSDEDYQKTGEIVSTWRASCRSACGPGESQTEDTLQPTVGLCSLGTRSPQQERGA